MPYPLPTRDELISTPEALRLPSPVRAVIFDFDGVMTENGVWVDQDGHEMVRCDRSDGLGLQMMMRAGVHACVISKERNPVVSARCRKIGVPCQQGIDDKGPVVLAWLAGLGGAADADVAGVAGLASGGGVDPAHAVYVGNDVNDLAAFAVVGCALAVADAHPVCLSRATAVLKRPGGRGAVRELCDAVLVSAAGG